MRHFFDKIDINRMTIRGERHFVMSWQLLWKLWCVQDIVFQCQILRNF